MNNKALYKLRSKGGATLAIALLLFLVCCFAGGLVVVSASGASGRLSELNDSDARYYAVKSAAELVRDEFDGKEFLITRTKTNVVITKVSCTITDLAVSRGAATEQSNTTTYTFTALDESNADVKSKQFLLRDASELIVFGQCGALITEDVIRTSLGSSFAGLSSMVTRSYALTAEDGSGDPIDYDGDGNCDLTVNITANISDSGLDLVFQSGDGKYTITESFDAVKDESGSVDTDSKVSSENETKNASNELTGFDEITTVTTIDTTITKISWSYSGMK